MPSATKQAFIHIGMNKTGSTAIQQACDGYSDPTKRFLRLGNTPNHSYALVLIHSDDPKHRYFRNAYGGRAVKMQGRLSAQYRRALQTPGDLVLSGEGLSNFFTPSMAKSFTDRLQAAGFECHARGYVREPNAFMRSSFSQLMKMGNAKFDTNSLWPNYTRRFKKWQAAMPPEALPLVPFSREALLNNSVVDDFAVWAGLDPAALGAQEGYRNASPSADALALIFATHLHGRGGTNWKRRALQLMVYRLQGFGALARIELARFAKLL